MIKFMALMLMFACSVAFGADPTDPAGADIITSILTFLVGIPKIGPVIVAILKYMGIVAVIFTVVAAILAAVAKILKMLAKPESTVLNKIIEVLDKVYPYIAWLGMQNVQKK